MTSSDPPDSVERHISVWNIEWRRKDPLNLSVIVLQFSQFFEILGKFEKNSSESVRTKIVLRKTMAFAFRISSEFVRIRPILEIEKIIFSTSFSRIFRKFIFLGFLQYRTFCLKKSGGATPEVEKPPRASRRKIAPQRLSGILSSLGIPTGKPPKGPLRGSGIFSGSGPVVPLRCCTSVSLRFVVQQVTHARGQGVSFWVAYSRRVQEQAKRRSDKSSWSSTLSLHRFMVAEPPSRQHPPFVVPRRQEEGYYSIHNTTELTHPKYVHEILALWPQLLKLIPQTKHSLENLKLQSFRGSDLLTRMLCTFCPPTILGDFYRIP